MDAAIKAWNERWRDGRIGFHQEIINPQLIEFWPEIVPNHSARVLVPLCGKTSDMLWLHQRGHTVIGIEASALAAAAFFEENSVQVDRIRQDEFEIFKGRGSGSGLEIWCGDFFTLSKGQLGKIQAWYDRAAVIALPPTLWAPYAAKLSTLLMPDATALMLAFAYSQGDREGPPFSVSYEDVQQQFSDRFDVSLIQTLDLTKGNRWQYRWVHEPIIKLRRVSRHQVSEPQSAS